MHFKHPEILYFLLLLIIPIIVHLFQFRRFQKEYFTNVRFLKEVITQTRKSSSIKKWLLLFTRMLLIAFLVLAFTQPYVEAKDKHSSNNELVVVLDNSHSMQAEGEKGELLERAIQDIIAFLPKGKVFSVITNDNQFWQTNVNAVQNELLKLKTSAQSFSLKNSFDRIHHGLTNQTKDVIIISDTKGVTTEDLEKIPSDIEPVIIQAKSNLQSNVSIDSVYVANTTTGFYELKIQLSTYGEFVGSVPLSIYNQGQAIAKTVVEIEQEKQEIGITIPNKVFHGYVSIKDKGLSYDNTYYFTISELKKNKVLGIGTSENNEFLSRIYTSDEFDYISTEVKGLAYNLIASQDVVVLNEIIKVPKALQTTLQGFVNNGGALIVIPTTESIDATLNQLTKTISGIELSEEKKQQRLITQINFEDKLFKEVFEQKVSNFQYPSVAKMRGVRGEFQTALAFDNNSPFLVSKENGLGQVYIFSAGLNTSNSNFKQSPLIVPTFYKMANQSLSSIESYLIGQEQTISVAVKLSKDDVLTVTDGKNSFIPQQKIGTEKVKINFSGFPNYAGNFQIKQGEAHVGVISFNAPRTESDITSSALNDYGTVKSANSLEEVLDAFKQNRTDNEIWRWLLILTLVFLLIEIVIQKFLK